MFTNFCLGLSQLVTSTSSPSPKKNKNAARKESKESLSSVDLDIRTEASRSVDTLPLYTAEAAEEQKPPVPCRKARAKKYFDGLERERVVKDDQKIVEGLAQMGW